jgi:ankyrin repeat protein
MIPFSAEDAEGMTPLHYAAWYNAVTCCQVLVTAGASLTKFDRNGIFFLTFALSLYIHKGTTPLHCAAFNGQLAAVVYLVEAGAGLLPHCLHSPLTNKISILPTTKALRRLTTQFARSTSTLLIF